MIRPEKPLTAPVLELRTGEVQAAARPPEASPALRQSATRVLAALADRFRFEPRIAEWEQACKHVVDGEPAGSDRAELAQRCLEYIDSARAAIDADEIEAATVSGIQIGQAIVRLGLVSDHARASRRGGEERLRQRRAERDARRRRVDELTKAFEKTPTGPTLAEYLVRELGVCKKTIASDLDALRKGHEPT